MQALYNSATEIRFDRVPPQDIDAERALLGALMFFPRTNSEEKAQSEVIDKAIHLGVIPEIFYKQAHQDICSAIFNLHEKGSPVDQVTLCEELESHNITLSDQQDNPDLIDEIEDSCPTNVNMGYYAEIVKENALKRSAGQEAVKLYNDSFDPTVEMSYRIKQHTESINNLAELYHPNNGKKNGYTAREIMSMDFPDSNWIVKNYIPEGLTVVAGAPKSGKSWFTLALALATAQPNNTGVFLGCLPVEKSGDVLYLGLEDSLRRINLRLNKLCKDERPPEALEFWIDIPTLSKGGIAKLENWIKSKAHPRLIVVDVLEIMRDHANARFKNAYEQDYEDLGLLKNLAGKTGISIVVVDHKRKQKSDDILDSITGSVGKQGAPDGILIIRKPRKETIGSLFRTGKDYDEDDEMTIKLDVNSGVGWSMVGKADEQRMRTQREAIIELLKSTNIPMTPKQIADNLDLKVGYIQTTLRRMNSDKLISQYEYGKYVLTR